MSVFLYIQGETFAYVLTEILAISSVRMGRGGYFGYIRGPQSEPGKHATHRAVTCRDLHSQPQLSHSAFRRKWAPRDRHALAAG